MSRAFVNEDAASEPEPTYTLPDPASEHYDRAAALALIEGANLGRTRSAEIATGYEWGEPRLAGEIEAILADAEERGEDRIVQLARRFLTRSEEFRALDEG